jgi:hypothetical protein
MSSRALRSAAAAGAAGALISIITSLAVPAGLMSDGSSPAWNTIDLVTDVLLAAGLAGFTASGAARGWLARIGLSLAFVPASYCSRSPPSWVSATPARVKRCIRSAFR